MDPVHFKYQCTRHSDKLSHSNRIVVVTIIPSIEFANAIRKEVKDAFFSLQNYWKWNDRYALINDTAVVYYIICSVKYVYPMAIRIVSKSTKYDSIAGMMVIINHKSFRTLLLPPPRTDQGQSWNNTRYFSFSIRDLLTFSYRCYIVWYNNRQQDSLHRVQGVPSGNVIP